MLLKPEAKVSTLIQINTNILAMTSKALENLVSCDLSGLITKYSGPCSLCSGHTCLLEFFTHRAGFPLSAFAVVFSCEKCTFHPNIYIAHSVTSVLSLLKCHLLSGRFSTTLENKCSNYFPPHPCTSCKSKKKKMN